MIGSQIFVGLGEIQAIQGESTFICIGLGSSVGICVGDPTAKVWGVAHVMLPRAFESGAGDRPAKFADTGITHLFEVLERLGGERENMVAVVVGGAQVIHGQVTRAMVEFGARNVETVKRILAEESIPLVGEDTGGNSGRTLTFEAKTGIITVRTPATPDRMICRIEEVAA